MANAASPSSASFPSMKRGLAVLGLSALIFVMTAFHVAPAMVFLFNGSEVTIPVTEVIRVSWGAQIGFIAVVIALGIMGGGRGRRILTSVLLALAALLYLQGNVFVWDYGRFDGTDIDWSRHRIAGVFEVIVWLGFLAAAVIFSKRLWKFMPRIAVIIVLLNAGSLGIQFLSGRTFAHATASGIDDQVYQFSKEKNTLIVILDAFSSPAFDLMLDHDPSWRDRLEGFTYYRDALGVYPTTLPSVPAILSGKTYDNTQPMDQFLRESLPGESLPPVLQDHGFLTHTITEAVYGEYLEGVPYANQISFLDTHPQNRKMRDSLRIWNIALFRYSPHFIKMQVYSDHKWLLRGAGVSPDTVSAPGLPFTDEEPYRVPTPGQQASWILWRQLVDNANAGSGRPTFKFIHLFTTHIPFFLDEECVQITEEEYAKLGWRGAVPKQCTCAMNQVLEILDRLREFGILDRTLVILAADHGNHINLDSGESTKVEPEGFPLLSKVLPLLLVKPMGAKGPLQVSRAQVSLIDIPNTVVADMGVDKVFPGYALQDAKEDETRTRVYYDYEWEHRFWFADHLPPMTEFRVNGPVRNFASWSKGRFLQSDGGK